ncbi:hypothetical protein [Streptomyces sp. NPDC017993]|uniref:hypothetical protein n=1 Tax=Streptomyces sp. NPDC017993 TaxID=3365027 RepID=UPI0037A29D40
MTERTTYLDPDPRNPRSRRISVRASRWYATVTLDCGNGPRWVTLWFLSRTLTLPSKRCA